jgi:hypothetical protein
VAIAFGAAGTQAAQTTGTTITPALPAGVAAGNLIISVACVKNNSTLTWPVGWTKVNQTNSGTLWTAAWAWRINAAGVTAPAITIGTSAAATAQCWSYTNQDPSNPIGAVGTVATGTTSPHTSTSITTTRANSLAIYIDTCSANTTLTQPTGYTQNFATGSATSVTALASGSKAVAATGTATGAISTTGGAAAWTQVQVEILAPTIGGYFSDHDIKPVNTGNTIAKRQMMQETAAWISPMSYCAFQYDFFAFQIIYGNPTYNAFQGCIAVPWAQPPDEPYLQVNNYLKAVPRGSEEIAGAPFTQPPAAPPTLPFSEIALGQMVKPKQLDHIDAPAPAFGEFLQSYLPQWTLQYDIPHLKSRFDVGADIWQPSFVRGEFLPDFVQWASQHELPQLKKRFDVGADIWQPSFVQGEFLQTYVSQWASQHDVPQLKKRFDVGPDIWLATPVAGEFLPTLVSQWASQHEIPHLKSRFAVGEDIWQPAFVPSKIFVQWATGHDLPRLKSRFSVGEDIWHPSFVRAEFIPSYVTQWDIPHDLPRLKSRFAVGDDIWLPPPVAGEFLPTLVSQWASQHEIAPIRNRTGPNGEIVYEPQSVPAVTTLITAWPWTYHDPIAKTFNPIRPLDNIWHQTPAFGEFLQSYISQWASMHELAPVRSRVGINGEIIYSPQPSVAVTLITAWPWTHHDPIARTWDPKHPLDNIWHQTPAAGEFAPSFISQWASTHDLPQLKKRFDVGPDIWAPTFVRGEFLQTYISQWASQHELPRLKARFELGADIWHPSFVPGEFAQTMAQWAVQHDIPRLKSRFDLGADIWHPSFVPGEFLQAYVSQWASEHPIGRARSATGPAGDVFYAPQGVALVVTTPTAWWMEYAPYQQTRANSPYSRLAMFYDPQWPPSIYPGGVVTIGLPHNQPFVNSFVGRMFGR